ncbi:hypothetical protein [Streptomyces sp. NPDC058620]|uniref:hypothetical protein n=1 Tax=Streptomyces sp. NPDC058620 TaxID=3346560 RepID=UPI0036514CB2
MTTRTAATLILLAATLTACTSTDPAPEKPAATSAPALSKAEITRQCVNAIAEAVSNRPADFDPETDSDPQPAACDALSEAEYMDAYMDGLSQAQ